MLFLIRHRYPRLGAVLSGGLLVVLAEHTHQYRRSLDISERLGNQAGMATSYHQLANLEEECGGQAATAIAWHVNRG